LKISKDQHLAWDTKHLVDNANLKGIIFNKHRNGLIGNCSEMPSFLYPSVTYRKPYTPAKTSESPTNKGKERIYLGFSCIEKF
jgi:hypothetical protein